MDALKRTLTFKHMYNICRKQLESISGVSSSKSAMQCSCKAFFKSLIFTSCSTQQCYSLKAEKKILY